ncbi:MAG: hypothetical protein AAGF11_35735 [Myxococcota bacterium]
MIDGDSVRWTLGDTFFTNVPAPPHTRRSTRRITVLGLLLLALVWAWTSPGLVSSNDGSHLALARALVLRGETTLGDEVALTLWVDRARREGHNYSDRPPGTALIAAPAAWLGAQLDPGMLKSSLESKEIIVPSAAPRYAETYTVRTQRMRVQAPPLLGLQGTALLLSLHCAAVGVFGIFGVLLLLRRRGRGPAAQAFAATTLGLGCLWGPYSTVLFSHVTAGTAVIWAVLGLEVGLGLGLPDEADDSRPVQRLALLGAGLAAGWAASADYLVGVLVLGVGLATVPPRRWLVAAPWLLLGALPIIAATLAYHHAAFGSPWSLGYDHHANFEFARDRLTTFGGNPLTGLWSQWGLGEGAGVLALAPVMLLGVLGLLIARERRWLLGALPWILLLAAHRTPTGGAAVDHRYLLPLMPLLAVGLAQAWSRWAEGPGRARAFAIGMMLLAILSAFLSWTHVRSIWA